MTQEIVSQTPISSAELHDEMKRIKTRDEELGFRAQKTIDYLDSLHTLDAKKAKRLLEKLLALNIPRLRDMHFQKIIDLMPTTAKDVKSALQSYNINVAQEHCKSIADVVSEYAEKKK